MMIFLPVLSACGSEKSANKRNDTPIQTDRSTTSATSNKEIDEELLVQDVNTELDNSKYFTAFYDDSNERIVLEATEDHFDDLHSLVSGFMDEQQAKYTLESYQGSLISASKIAKNIPVVLLSPAAEDFLILEAINGNLTQDHTFDEGANQHIVLKPSYSHDESDGIFDLYEEKYVSTEEATKAVISFFKHFAAEGVYEADSKTFNLKASGYYLTRVKQGNLNKEQELDTLKKNFTKAANRYGDDITVVINNENDKSVGIYAIYYIDIENTQAYDD